MGQDLPKAHQEHGLPNGRFENKQAMVVGFFVGFCPGFVGIHLVLFRFIPNFCVRERCLGTAQTLEIS